MSTRTTTRPASPVTVVRQLVLHGLLFILLMVFTTGLADLIASALRGFQVEGLGMSQLPMALASVLIAGPLAWLLWRRLRLLLTEAGERDSVIWSVQAAAVYAFGLTAAAHYLGALLGQLAGGRSTIWQDQLGLAIAWGLLAAWQYRVLRDPRVAPLQLGNLGWLLACYYCLLIAALSAAALLGIAIRQLLPAGTEVSLAGAGSLPALANIAVWVAVNFAVFAWHWFGIPLRTHRTAFAQFLLVLAVATAAAAMLLGTVFVVASGLPLPADAAALSARVTQVLPTAAGFALAGAVAWVYFAAVLWQAEAPLREAGRQVLSGIALALGATGFGMVVNALLASLDPPLAGNAPADLLRVGLALFVIGLGVWLVFWRPAASAQARSRRVYLVLVFGVSAVVALVALLVVGYRIFAFYLTPEQAGPTLVGDVRAALGLLLATAVVFAYHFAVWRADRGQLDADGQLSAPRAGYTAGARGVPSRKPPAGPASILLVTDATNSRLAGALQEATGIPVHHLVRSDQSGPQLPDVAALASSIGQLPPGTEQVLVVLDAEQTLLIPVHRGTGPRRAPR